MIERAAAIEVARQRAEQKGWPFAEPLSVVYRRGWFGRTSRFEVETNAGQRGTKARFVIDAATGSILSEGYIPR
jgi:hypothetical protein